MKKVISKILIIFILIILLFEFAFSNRLISYAEDDIALPAEQLEQIASLGNGLVAIILWIPKFIVTGLTALINQSTSLMAKMENKDDPGTITPYKIFFGKYELLSVNMFKEAEKDSFVKEFRNSIATWYYVVRLIAVALLLVILVYVGIRMAIASVADDKAKYKKMLFDWVVGLALIFVIHYIAIFTVYCNDAIVHAIEVAYESESDTAEGMINAIFMKSLVGLGLIADAAMIVYIGIVFQTIFYLIAYINRMLKVGFLLVISPLITVTYAIDKMGDGKAQALGNWLKEYIYTILIQPFHCIIYFTFVSTAFKLVVKQAEADYSYNALSAGILAILCIKFINDAEKIVKKIFGIQDGENKTALAAGAVMGIAMAKNATKIASGVKGGAIGVKAFGSKFKSDFIKEAPKLQQIAGDKGVGKYIGKAIGGASNALNKIDGVVAKGKDKLNNNPIKRKINGVKKNYGDFKKKHKYMGKALNLGERTAQYAGRKALSTSAAIMGFAATYATGDTDALSAIGYGTAAGKGADELFNNSSKRNRVEGVKDVEEATELMHQALEKEAESANEELEDAKEQLEGAEQSYKDAEPALNHYKRAEALDAKADALGEQVTNERRALEGLKPGSPKYQKAMKNIKPKEDKIKKLREQAKEARKAGKDEDKTGEVTEKINSKMKAKDIEDEYKKNISTKADNLKNKDSKSRKLDRELREFYSAEATKARHESMRHSVTDQTIKDKAKDIEKLIQKMIAKRNEIANSGNDNANNDEMVSYEDMQNGKRMASLLQANIEKDFIEHSGVSSEDLLQMSGGTFLSTDYGKGEADKELVSEMHEMEQQLEKMVLEDETNYRMRGIDNAAEVDSAMGGYSDKFDSEILDGALANASYRRGLEDKQN